MCALVQTAVGMLILIQSPVAEAERVRLDFPLPRVLFQEGSQGVLRSAERHNPSLVTRVVPCFRWEMP